MSEPKLKYIFIVQGEGRGHLTQALSLRQMLAEHGHTVCCILAGKSLRRKIPDFFIEKIQTPVFTFESPNFVADSKNKSVKIFPTILYNLKRLPYYYRSMNFLEEKVQEFKPDIIINFYDLLCGFYFLLKKPDVTHICVGHQYLLMHNKFCFPKGKWIDRMLVLLNTHATAIRATKKLALSFREMKEDRRRNILVVPPLLRQEVLELHTEREDFLLGYMVNDGYAEEIMDWHKHNREVKIVCFWDRKDMDDEYREHENLIFHRISDRKFLDHMRRCKGYMSTAGFESICEAIYLEKPVLLVPTKGHFEQECNAFDAVDARAGISAPAFDITAFLHFLPEYSQDQSVFREWVKRAESLFIKELTKIK